MVNEKLITDKIQELMDEQEDTRIYAGLEKALEVIWQMSDPLNDNQQIVLEWLKSNDYSLKLPMLAINQLDRMTDLKVRKAHWQLGRKQEYEVLAAFAQWGLEQEENHNGIN